MKTGRVRKKAQPPPEEQEASPQPPPAKPPSHKTTSARSSPRRARKVPIGVWIVGGLFLIFVCFVMIMMVFGRKKPEEWVKATRATGSWTTTILLYAPQVTTEERWETECISTPDATVRVGTCVMKDTDTYHDDVVDDYEEYAYNIYYEETWDKTYQAQGTEFTVTGLGADDWWQENLHYVLEEELDNGSCEYTNYTLWVSDPNNKAQEIEVYLSECEVWDHVTVYERVYEEKSWCQCDVTTLVQMGQQSEQGAGLDVRWASPRVPVGGRTERSFTGKVIFLGDDYTYTTTTDDLARYQDYLTSQYYIGLRDDKPVTVSANPPKE